ncbi:hypothetical protein ABNB56_11405 [Streptococcus iniae]|uniref:hypothetical protein n=1 Tax=Streptococcus iniae TaxID=1346 RepID=UPI000EFBB2DD|nr:hypothetical protein [Streptococcus iniae]RMI77643.1 hypothetical protein DIX58_04190 [Streptococcus iniae]
MKKACATCGKFFEATSNRATYCSEECRKIGVSEKQKLLMRKKRKEEKERKEAKLKTNIENRTKPKKIRDIEKYYQKKKQELLENEKQFDYVGRILIEGIDIHDPNFEKLIMEKIE